MKTNKNLKEVVREKYAQVIESADKKDSLCTCCPPDSTADNPVFCEDYSKLDGYNKDADLSLGCGIPTEFAQIKEGDIVLDLGSGAGNDCFVARAIVGDKGKVTGLDFTEEMIEKARGNSNKLGYQNIEFVCGDIEDIPLPSESINVVISNCVLNLVPDKEKAFSEIYRVLKSYSHFCISDIILEGSLPEGIKNETELYAGCISGALQLNDYLEIVQKAGFKNVEVLAKKEIILPENLLLKYLTKQELENYKNNNTGIYSVTIFGGK